MNPVLRVTDVEFGYHPGKPVLRDISFEVSPGEVFIILGANGCGKSTLMRTILGECKPTSGRITVGGDDVTSLGVKQLAQRMAMVFQDHSAPFPFTVLDVVKMGRTPHLPPFASPTKKDNVICLEALETVGLKDLAFEPYTQLSGGERQLVLIARALAQRTGVVLMDEPTSHLDYRNATTVISTAHTLAHEQDKAVVMITHLPDQAFYYPSRVALMRNGRFFASGPSEAVLTSENLSKVYGMDMLVLTASDENGRRYLTCRPALSDPHGM
ncbi:ABC transporter ATP-binding protein [Arachnia rubra]|jgi:ABC transporter related protein|uniref:ABC transporter ATP-binding protein n=1 Tax=Arachnia rubra TaxID=1547448 RepID=A0ABX7Y2S6_9ACTN|nr:ABC transporter ATP-binding protein [Arachnia rubra]QUC07382.1 ABC transporter ATP-binding protein [Arachnia rubra]BCR81665.1 iron ABC transporter ATP-binding protein [Arachnia rubra]